MTTPPKIAESDTPIVKTWSIETIELINALTPNIKQKSYDPDWFLLRQRFERFEAQYKQLERELSTARKQLQQVEKERDDYFDTLVAITEKLGYTEQVAKGTGTTKLSDGLLHHVNAKRDSLNAALEKCAVSLQDATTYLSDLSKSNSPKLDDFYEVLSDPTVQAALNGIKPPNHPIE